MISRNGQQWPSTGNDRPVLMMAGQKGGRDEYSVVLGYLVMDNYIMD